MSCHAGAEQAQFPGQMGKLMLGQMGREQGFNRHRSAAAVVIRNYFARMAQPSDDSGSFPDALRA
ncbi:hypothetical protein D3C75_1176030 [compost metagenome]